MNYSTNNNTVKQVLKDLADISTKPIPGISICMPDCNNPFTLHGNIIIKEGPYEGILLHFIVHIPEDYPSQAPAVNISMGLGFGNKFHKYIRDNINHGNVICTDYTSTYTGKFSSYGAKWNSSCNLSTVMNQLQEFFAKPEIPAVTKEELKRLKDHAKDYKIHVKVNHDGSGSYIVTHSSNNRYPPLATPVKEKKKEEVKEVVEEVKIKVVNTDNSSTTPESSSPSNKSSSDESPRRKDSEVSQASKSSGYSEVWVGKERLVSKLACSVSKVDIFDASKPLLGYAVRLDKDSNTGKISPVIRLKMISYETFKTEAAESKNKMYWLPIYGKSRDFKKNRRYILDSITIIYADLVGEPKAAGAKFEPRMALKVLLPLLVKTISHFYNEVTSGSSFSTASLEVFCQLYYLLGKLAEDRRSLQESVDKEVESFLNKEERRHKRHSGELFEFIFKLTLSYSEFYTPETFNLVLKEYLARNVNTVLKKDKSYYFERNCPSLVERFMTVVQPSSELLLFIVAVGKMLIDPTVRGGLEGRLGLVSEEMVKNLRTTALGVHKNLKNKWEVLVDGLDQGEYVYNDKVMENYVMGAFNAAKNKGYLY